MEPTRHSPATASCRPSTATHARSSRPQGRSSSLSPATLCSNGASRCRSACSRSARPWSRWSSTSRPGGPSKSHRSVPRRGRRDRQLRPRAGLFACHGSGTWPGAQRIDGALEEAKERSGFIKNIFCRFSDYLLAQTMQNVACNAFHSIPQRAARWLLHAQDRAGDRIELTQEAFAGLARRAAHDAQRGDCRTVVRGLDRDRRGTVRVLDRVGLKRRSCDCYRVLEEHFAVVIGSAAAAAEARVPS